MSFCTEGFCRLHLIWRAWSLLTCGSPLADGLVIGHVLSCEVADSREGRNSVSAMSLVDAAEAIGPPDQMTIRHLARHIERPSANSADNSQFFAYHSSQQPGKCQGISAGQSPPDRGGRAHERLPEMPPGAAWNKDRLVKPRAARPISVPGLAGRSVMNTASLLSAGQAALATGKLTQVLLLQNFMLA
jgi:hypothetical protein